MRNEIHHAPSRVCPAIAVVILIVVVVVGVVNRIAYAMIRPPSSLPSLVRKGAVLYCRKGL